MKHRPLVVATLALALGSGLVLVALVAPARAGAGGDAPAARSTDSTIKAAWRALPSIEGHGCADEDLVFDYGTDGGMRNFFCRALTVVSWKAFLALAPAAPFRKGPHKGGKLKLHSRDFGFYDPAFVKWATQALVPAVDDPAFRAETQGIYDAQVRALARVYFRVFRALDHDPTWVAAERKTYLGAADRGKTEALGRNLDLYHDTLGTAGDDWGGADPNHVRSATTWWLRRYHDKTAPLWAEGLEHLLAAYDGAWLAEQKAATPRPLPQRKKPRKAPEYR